MGIRPQAWLVIALRPPREVIFLVIDLPEGIGIPRSIQRTKPVSFLAAEAGDIESVA